MNLTHFSQEIKMRKATLLIVSTLLAVLLFTGCFSPRQKNTIVVGAKYYTEQEILGHVLKFLIEEHTDLSVTVKSSLDSLLAFEGIKSGEIDVYIDYTGTVYGNYLGIKERRTPTEIYDICKKELKDRFNLLMLDQIGFNNTYTMSVRKDTAAKYNLKTISDLAKVASGLTIGASIESLNREDSVKGITRVYGFNFKREVAVESSLRYIAIENDEIQVTDAFSTDGLTLKYDLVVLEDNLEFFPAYHAAAIIGQSTADKYPKLLEVLGMLTGTLNDDKMRSLNYRVDVNQEDPPVVARDFLKEAGLIK